MKLPENKKFAFTILDDTDSANCHNVKPVYEYLHHCGFRTTKTVWPLAYDDEQNSKYIGSSTLADDEYKEFVLWLAESGFEITWHGATMESSSREDICLALERYNDVLDDYPNIQVNHAHNRENLYWGLNRFNSPIIKFILKQFGNYQPGDYSGEINESRHFWADIASQHFRYCRGLTFKGIDVTRINPSMPYRDPTRPAIPFWFSTSSVDSFIEFEETFTRKNIDKLVRNRGICILSTHLGKGYTNRNGNVRDSIKSIFDYIAAQDGCFIPVGELLDWLQSQQPSAELSYIERQKMEWLWMYERLSEKLFTPRKSREWWELLD